MQTLIDQKKWDHAGVILKELAEAHPHFFVWYQQAVVHVANSNAKEALISLNKSIQLNPDFARSYYLRMTCYDQLRNPEKVLASAKDWEGTADLSGWDIEPSVLHYTIASTLSRHSLTTEAIKHMELAIELMLIEHPRRCNALERLHEAYETMIQRYDAMVALVLLAEQCPSHQRL